MKGQPVVICRLLIESSFLRISEMLRAISNATSKKIAQGSLSRLSLIGAVRNNASQAAASEQGNSEEWNYKTPAANYPDVRANYNATLNGKPQLLVSPKFYGHYYTESRRGEARQELEEEMDDFFDTIFDECGLNRDLNHKSRTQGDFAKPEAEKPKRYRQRKAFELKSSRKRTELARRLRIAGLEYEIVREQAIADRIARRLSVRRSKTSTGASESEHKSETINNLEIRFDNDGLPLPTPAIRTAVKQAAQAADIAKYVPKEMHAELAKYDYEEKEAILAKYRTLEDKAVSRHEARLEAQRRAFVYAEQGLRLQDEVHKAAGSPGDRYQDIVLTPTPKNRSLNDITSKELEVVSLLEKVPGAYGQRRYVSIVRTGLAAKPKAISKAEMELQARADALHNARVEALKPALLEQYGSDSREVQALCPELATTSRESQLAADLDDDYEDSIYDADSMLDKTADAGSDFDYIDEYGTPAQIGREFSGSEDERR